MPWEVRCSAIALADTFTTIIPPFTNRRQNRCASSPFIIQPPHLTAYLSLSILKDAFWDVSATAASILRLGARVAITSADVFTSQAPEIVCVVVRNHVSE